LEKSPDIVAFDPLHEAAAITSLLIQALDKI